MKTVKLKNVSASATSFQLRCPECYKYVSQSDIDYNSQRAYCCACDLELTFNFDVDDQGNKMTMEFSL